MPPEDKGMARRYAKTGWGETVTLDAGPMVLWFLFVL